MTGQDGAMRTFPLNADGVDLHVLDSGGDLPVVLLLHGLAGHAGEWTAVADLLSDRFRVVAFDQRGNGRSTRRPADLSRQAHVDDVVAVARRLGIEQLTLVGQSMGAHTALLAAAWHPELVERLVLVEGGVGGEGTAVTENVLGWFAGWPVPFTSEGQAAEFFGGGAAGTAWAAGLERSPSGLVPRFDLDVLRGALAPVHAEARWEEWATVQCPVVLMKGARGFAPLEELTRMVETQPLARLVEVDDAGHDVHLDAPQAVAAVMMGTL